AMELCVRVLARVVPRRRPPHCAQLQFHCGKPPPAPEPSTRIFMIASSAASARRDVHRDLEAEAKVLVLGGGPCHGDLLKMLAGDSAKALPQETCRWHEGTGLDGKPGSRQRHSGFWCHAEEQCVQLRHMRGRGDNT